MSARVAVDIGGTFTDLVALDETTGEVDVAKASTTPGRFEEGVLDAVDQVDLDGVAYGVVVDPETLELVRVER
jgi:N-methylhydantoinase A